MLDDIGSVSHDPRHEHFAVGQLDLFPHAPFMLMARVGSFDGNRMSAHFQDQIDDISERNVVLMRTVIAAPAGVKRTLSGGMSLRPWLSASTRSSAYLRYSSTVIRDMNCQPSGRSGSSIWSRRPASTMALYSSCIASAMAVR